MENSEKHSWLQGAFFSFSATTPFSKKRIVISDLKNDTRIAFPIN